MNQHKETHTKPHVVILHNIRSAHNVGAILRTADAIGISEVYMTGYTPTPLDRFGRKRSDVSKAALGAEESVSWTHYKSVAPLITKLKKTGYSIVGIEQDDSALDYKTFKTVSKTAFLFGNEVRGLSPQLKKQCDVLIEIPMRGMKESLNVTTAAGIALFRVLDI